MTKHFAAAALAILLAFWGAAAAMAEDAVSKMTLDAAKKYTDESEKRMKEAVDTNTGAINNYKMDIDKHIAAGDANIKKIGESLAEGKKEITDNSAAIKKNADAIAVNKSGVKKNEDAIAKTIEAAEKDRQAVAKNTEAVAKNTEAVRAAEAGLGDDEFRKTSVQQRLEALNKRFDEGGAGSGVSKAYADKKAAETLKAANEYTDSRYSRLDGKIKKLRGEARAGTAAALAAAGLNFGTAPGKNSVAGGIGVWKDKAAGAVGFQHNFKNNWHARGTLSLAEKGSGGAVSAGYEW